MKRIMVILVAGFALLLMNRPAAAQSNLVINGDFEEPGYTVWGSSEYLHSASNGIVPGWTMFPAPAPGQTCWSDVKAFCYDAGIDYERLPLKSEKSSFVIDTSSQPGTLSQTLATQNGSQYKITYSLELHDYCGKCDAPGNAFSVSWNGTPIRGSILTNATSFDWTEYSFLVTATGSDTLSFSGFSDDNELAFALDDISVTTTAPVGDPTPLVNSAKACPEGNSTLISNLGTAGPSNFAVLSLGGVGALVNLSPAFVTGAVGVPNSGTIKESAQSSVTGELIVGSAVSSTGSVESHGPITVNDSLLNQAVADARSGSAYFANLPYTPSVQAQFPANGQITINLTVIGTPGLNVVNLPNFLLNNGSGTLTLTGPAGTAFVINDSGNFNLHSGNINVGGGVGPLDVVYNITNPKATVTTAVATTAVGILLAPNNNINAMEGATFTGEVIGGYKNTIALTSGTRVMNPCQQ